MVVAGTGDGIVAVRQSGEDFIWDGFSMDADQGGDGGVEGP